MQRIYVVTTFLFLVNFLVAQNTIPLDTVSWNFSGSYFVEKHHGKNAVYLKDGAMTLKNTLFYNGTIEYDIFLKDAPGYPGVYFRYTDEGDAEQFYIRPHLSGKPDANQAAPLIKGITPWQLFFGPRYSFPYNYKYDDWTHVKLVINDNKAQVYLDYSETPNHSWILTHSQKKGKIILIGGNRVGLHIADIKIDDQNYQLKKFEAINRDPIPDLVSKWTISDKFEESHLSDFENLDNIISKRKWLHEIGVDEGVSANISKAVKRYDNAPSEKNTVFAKLEITSDINIVKKFEFGYSDRAMVILNGKPIYWGDNKWKSRDYRYLGTIGLFDAVYLNLKKGKNTLLVAVSEDFGGWLVTGRFKNMESISIE